ncbi:MAG TPA: hypothetical protein VGI31_09755 [Streptosporangiaceae bacterium]
MLGIVAILLIVVSILYFTQPAHSLPSILGSIKSPVHRADEKRSLRGVITLVVALVCLAGCGFAFLWKGRDRN